MRERTGLPALYTKGDCAQMVALALPYRDPVALKRRLFDDYRVEVPVTQHGGHLFVRVSVQGYNQSSDLVALEAAIGAIYGMRS
jgi:isopenicillin-N epimerase